MRRVSDQKNLPPDFAMQSVKDPRHVAAIMDGNGRWARRRGLPRSTGHARGAKAVRRTIEAAPRLGINVLSLYAFSCDNWKRPRTEVDALMDLFERYLESEVQRCIDNGVRIVVFGRRDRLRPSLLERIDSTEDATLSGSRLLVRLAVDYSSRWAILQAARGAGHASDSRSFENSLMRAVCSPTQVGEVDLLIRTGGERRLSDFLLWECAYTELHFTDCLWPDFGETDLILALEDYLGRERRYGGLPSTRPTAAIGRVG